MITDELHKRIMDGEKSALVEFGYLMIQEALKSLPLANEFIMKQSAVLHEKSRKFYDENKDLVNYKPEVAEVIQKIEASNPGRDLDVVLKEAGEKTRSMLRQKQQMGGASSSVATRDLGDLDKSLGEL